MLENLWFTVVILIHAENFYIFFPEKLLPCVCGEMDTGDLGNGARAIADCTVLKMSCVFIRLCFI